MGPGALPPAVAGKEAERLVTRWAGEVVPEAGDLARRLGEEGLEPYMFTMGPGERYGLHQHDHDEVRWVVRGSVRFGLGGGGRVVLGPGDRLDLPAHTPHDARTVGSAPCAMVSAARRSRRR